MAKRISFIAAHNLTIIQQLLQTRSKCNNVAITITDEVRGFFLVNCSAEYQLEYNGRC